MFRVQAAAHFNFLDFSRAFKIFSVCTENRRNPGCSLAVEYSFYKSIYGLKIGFRRFRCCCRCRSNG